MCGLHGVLRGMHAGADAIIEMRQPERWDGKECDVIAVRPEGEDFWMLCWIDRQSKNFARFVLFDTNQDPEDRGICEARYKVIEFPKQLDNRLFSAIPDG